MGNRLLAVGGDRRQALLARRLAALGRVDTLAVPGLPDTAESIVYDALVLPCPAFDGKGQLRSGEGTVPLSGLEGKTDETTRVFGGALSAGRSWLAARCGTVTDLLEDPRVAAQNASLTAQAALCLVMERTGRTPAGQDCAVLGYGRIGKVLARLLSALGARVTVAARRPEILAEAEVSGCLPRSFARAAEENKYLFNTVPAPVVSGNQRFRPDALWIELASAPGGLPAEPETKPALLRAGGLPGKLLPESAAEVLYEGILREWEGSQ